MTEAQEFYSGSDPALMPLYSFAEAARILKIPPTTLRYWLKGGSVTSRGPDGRFRRVLQSEVGSGVSFANLIELQILRVLRHQYGIPVENIRRAQIYASAEMGLEHPLLRDILVGGREIFIREVGQLVNLNRSGQIAIGELLERCLARIEFDSDRLPTRFFPFVPSTADRASVQVSPRIRFGVPTVRDTGIATSVIAWRVDAGEDLDAIARDYGLDVRRLRDALIFETELAA